MVTLWKWFCQVHHPRGFFQQKMVAEWSETQNKCHCMSASAVAEVILNTDACATENNRASRRTQVTSMSRCCSFATSRPTKKLTTRTSSFLWFRSSNSTSIGLLRPRTTATVSCFSCLTTRETKPVGHVALFLVWLHHHVIKTRDPSPENLSHGQRATGQIVWRLTPRQTGEFTLTNMTSDVNAQTPNFHTLSNRNTSRTIGLGALITYL